MILAPAKKTHLFTIGINEYLQEWVIKLSITSHAFVLSPATWIYMIHFTVFKLRHDFVEVMSTVDTSTPLFVSWLVSQWLAKTTPRQHTMEPHSNCSSQSQWASYEVVLATKATVLFWLLSCWVFWEVPKNDIIIDIGHNFGFVSWMFDRFNPIKVIRIESTIWERWCALFPTIFTANLTYI